MPKHFPFPGDDESRDPEELFPEAPTFNWRDDLRILLDPYEPASTFQEADVTFTTPEIMQALEQHYASPGAIIGKDVREPIGGQELVDELTRLGFRPFNAGGLVMQWLMKEK